MRAKLSSRSRRFALGGLVVMLLPVGLAHLAENAVPVTHAGVTETSVTIARSLTLQDAKVNVAQQDYYQFTNLKATLTFNGDPVEGATVVFKVADVPVCTGVTDKSGVANCPSNDKPARSEFPAGDPLSFTYVAVVSGGPLDGLESSPAHLEKITGGGADLTGNSNNNGSNS